MDLRSLPENLSPLDRVRERAKRIESERGVDLSRLAASESTIGDADSKNCEQMFGHVPIPVGYAGPLAVTFSNGEPAEIHLPLATTEGALVASVNRGCKAVSRAGGVKIERAMYHGITRSLGFKVQPQAPRLHQGYGGRESYKLQATIKLREREWKSIGESTSDHLKILSYDIDTTSDHLFLTIACDTDEAMGMNMVTIASQAIGEWIESNVEGLAFVTVAANVDSDKKPSVRTHDRGRGFEVIASAEIDSVTIESVLKTSTKAVLRAAEAKLKIGSRLAGAIGSNLHAANVIAALYLSTGQDAAHVVEGSLADTTVELNGKGLRITVRLPAILVGVRGGGTALPAQLQCLQLLMKSRTRLHPKQQLAESVAATVLAGELSLLAAQASHTVAKAHKILAR